MIRKIYLIGLCLLTFITVFAKSKGFEIKGKWISEENRELSVYRVSKGNLQKVASTYSNGQDGLFGFLLFPSEPELLIIGTGNADDPKGKFAIWAGENEKIALELSDSTCSLLEGKVSKENILLSEWQKLSHNVRYSSLFFIQTIATTTYIDFFPALQELEIRRGEWLSSVKSIAPKFYDFLEYYTEQDLAFLANYFLATPRMKYPDRADLPSFYRNRSTNRLFLNTENMYRYPFGRLSLKLQLERESFTIDRDLQQNDPLEFRFSYLENDTLKGYYLLDYLKNYQDHSNYLGTKDRYGKYILTEDQRKEDVGIASKFNAFNHGDMGLDFTYPDIDGKKVSLSDFRGKVVLVDVWATWCGPCKQEIPHLKKLQRELIGKDIQVISVTIDSEKDRDKWKSMVEKEELGGLHLFGGKDADIMKYYKIGGIPRFMVFDKNGRIVSINAPRPSEESLKALILRELDKH